MAFGACALAYLCYHAPSVAAGMAAGGGGALGGMAMLGAIGGVAGTAKRSIGNSHDGIRGTKQTDPNTGETRRVGGILGHGGTIDSIRGTMSPDGTRVGGLTGAGGFVDKITGMDQTEQKSKLAKKAAEQQEQMDKAVQKHFQSDAGRDALRRELSGVNTNAMNQQDDTVFAGTSPFANTVNKNSAIQPPPLPNAQQSGLNTNQPNKASMVQPENTMKNQIHPNTASSDSSIHPQPLTNTQQNGLNTNQPNKASMVQPENKMINHAHPDRAANDAGSNRSAYSTANSARTSLNDSSTYYDTNTDYNNNTGYNNSGSGYKPPEGSSAKKTPEQNTNYSSTRSNSASTAPNTQENTASAQKTATNASSNAQQAVNGQINRAGNADSAANLSKNLKNNYKRNLGGTYE
jgi:hypothetical protein